VALEARPLADADVAALEAWFADPATVRWVGTPGYPRRLLELARAPSRLAFAVTAGGEPVALVDVELDGAGSSAAIALVVAPRVRGRGVGRAALAAVMRRRELAAVAELVAEVEDANVTARRCILAAGFRPIGAAADAGFTRYALRRRRPGGAAAGGAAARGRACATRPSCWRRTTRRFART
jgi:RimJ/RimL family protein N-acetyltransferase